MNRSLVVKHFLICLVGFSAGGASQTHTFNTWRGGAWKPSDDTRQYGYTDTAFTGEFLEEVEIAELNIPPQKIDVMFPGTFLRGAYCMLLYSTLTVHEDGCYEVSLTSDDGSILWLDDETVINNDGPHRMRLRKTRIALDSGAHPAKLWYYNGFFDECGLILNMKRLGIKDSCDGYKPVKIPEPIVLQGETLFETGMHELSESAEASLQVVCDSLQGKRISYLSIVGHTDNVGHKGENNRLSKRRAGAVVTFLRSCLDLSEITLSVDGRGSDLPIAPNDTPEGRAQNRRVEIYVE